MERLDQIITKAFEPSVANREGIQELAALTVEIDEITEQVKSYLKSEMFSDKSAHVLEREIQGYQSTLTRLLDTLTKYLHAIEGDSVDNELKIKRVATYHHAINALDELLSFIERHLSKFFNVDEKIPDVYATHNRKIFQPKYIQSEHFLHARIADARLVAIALQPLKDFIEEKEDTYSFRQLMYLKELIGAFQCLGSLHKEDCAYSRLSEKLVYLNFNSIDFINHFTCRINAMIQPLETLDEKILKLTWHLKEISQMHIKPGTALNHGWPSVSEKVALWLIEEIKYYRRLQSPEFLQDIAYANTGDSNQKLTWTASKTDLVELLYGIFYTSALNNGTLNLKQIATFLETTFDISIGDFYRTYLQMRIRKNRTAFLNRMKKVLEEKMDELDENPSA